MFPVAGNTPLHLAVMLGRKGIEIYTFYFAMHILAFNLYQNLHVIRYQKHDRLQINYILIKQLDFLS